MENLRRASKTSKRNWYQIDEPKTVIVEEISFEIQKMSGSFLAVMSDGFYRGSYLV